MKNFIPILACFLFTIISFSQDFTIDIEVFAGGFDTPVDLQNAGDDRLFVVEQEGVIKILNADGTTNATPFLDISTLVSGGSEQGLLGLAFHPNYASNGFFFVNYTDNGGDTQVSRFSVSGDPDIADAGSELEIIDYIQPFPNHNGGSLQFGPNDGYLYISSGDGGSGGDPGNRAQNTTLLLGKLLRIDIDNTSGGNNYDIPLDNPFEGSATDAEEIWAYGLRNPWKFSFDSANGDIWIGDVGQELIEEIDRADGNQAGLNYGWRCYEGSDPFNTSGCPDPSELTFPIAEYSSGPGSGNCSITGGYVYRGSDYPIIDGQYFYADLCSGEIGTVDSGGNLIDHGTFGGTWTSFGEDVNNELYIVTIGGTIYKITAEEILSVDDPMAEASIEIFPNPASEQIQIQLSNDRLNGFELIDINGRIVMEESGLNISNRTLITSSLSAGMYFARLHTANQGTVVKKLILR